VFASITNEAFYDFWGSPNDNCQNQAISLKIPLTGQ
jgi:hypothetical protein